MRATTWRGGRVHGHPGGRALRRRGFGRVDALAALALLGVAGAVAAPTLRACRAKSEVERCAGQLRGLALAALAYGDDHRFLPHVRRLTEADGDEETGDAPCALRLLVHDGYLDGGAAFVCPGSDDAPAVRPDPPTPPRGAPGAEGVPDRASARDGSSAPAPLGDGAWFWGGASRPEAVRDVGPLADGLADPALVETTELSYAWTRRGHNTNCRCDPVVLADRAVRPPADALPGADPGSEPGPDPGAVRPGERGNHDGQVLVATRDGQVSRWRVAGDARGGTGPRATGEPTGSDAAYDEPRGPYGAEHVPVLGTGGSTWRSVPLRPPAPGQAKAFCAASLGALALAWLGARARGERRAKPKPVGPLRRRAGAPPPGAWTPHDAAAGPLQPHQRCPLCHDALAAPLGAAGPQPQVLVACAGCRTVTHDACATEVGACSTLGCPHAGAFEAGTAT